MRYVGKSEFDYWHKKKEEEILRRREEEANKGKKKEAKKPLGLRSNLQVAGTMPSFFSRTGNMLLLSTRVLGNFITNVLSSNHSLGFSIFSVGKAPSPLRSKKSLWVLGFYSPFSTIASKTPAYWAII